MTPDLEARVAALERWKQDVMNILGDVGVSLNMLTVSERKIGEKDGVPD